MDTPLGSVCIYRWSRRSFAFGLAAVTAGCLLAWPAAAQENPADGLSPDQITELARENGGGGVVSEAADIGAQMNRYFGGMADDESDQPAGIQAAAGEDAGKTKYRYDPKKWDPLEPVMPERLFHNIPKRDIIEDEK